MYYGWRGKIGIITPATGFIPEYEFNKYLPVGVAACAQRILFESVTPEGLAAMGDRVVDAARMLSYAKPDIIVFCCTTGSMINGLGYDMELIDKIEDATGIQALTTTTAVVQALKALQSQKVVVSTPYSKEVNEIEKNS